MSNLSSEQPHNLSQGEIFVDTSIPNQTIAEENEKLTSTESEKERQKLKEVIEKTSHFSEETKKAFTKNQKKYSNYRKFYKNFCEEKKDHHKLKSLMDKAIEEKIENFDKTRQDPMPGSLINSTFFGNQSNICRKPVESDKDTRNDEQEDEIKNQPQDSKSFEKINLSAQNQNHSWNEEFAHKINFLLERQKQFEENDSKRKDEIKGLNNEIKGLNDEIKGLNEKNANLIKTNGYLEKQVEKLTTRVGINEQEIKNLKLENQKFRKLLDAVLKRGNIEFMIRAYFSIPENYKITCPSKNFDEMLKEIFENVENNFVNFYSPPDPKRPEIEIKCTSYVWIERDKKYFFPNMDFLRDLVERILKGMDVTNPEFTLINFGKNFIKTSNLYHAYSELIHKFQLTKKSQLTFDKEEKKGCFIDLLSFFDEKLDEVFEKLKKKDDENKGKK